MNKQN